MKAKTANAQKLPDGRIKIELKEDEKTVATVEVTETERDSIIEGWQNGTYQLLTE
jgi:hypothetical protein